VWNEEFRFTLDAAACAESAKCSRFFTQEENGLVQDWAGDRVWLNPPYSNIAPWVQKAHDQVLAGADLVVGLLPAWPDRQWWQTLIEPYRDGKRGDGFGPAIQTRNLPGRIRFGYPGNPDAIGSDTPTFPSVLIIWRPHL